jgi:predicted porin
MKKTLIALAVLGTFAGAASAQSSVTLYGYGDIGVGKSIKATSSAAANGFQVDPSLADVGGVRVGLKGTEDLGGGMSASYQLESNAYSGDTGAGDGGYGRATWFGLGGSFGTIKVGRQARQAVIAAVAYSPAGWRGSDAQFATGIRYSIENNTNNNAGSSRNSSEISYTTPNLGGVVVRVGFEPKQDSVGTVGSVLDIGANGNFGPVSVGLGYMKQQTLAANWGLHASYDLGAVKIMAGHANVGKLATATAANGLGIGGNPNGVNAAVKGNSVGFTAPLGAITLFGEVAKSNRKNAAGASYQDSAVEFGGDYNLSKRTALTASLEKVKDASLGYYAGIRHSF